MRSFQATFSYGQAFIYKTANFYRNATSQC